MSGRTAVFIDGGYLDHCLRSQFNGARIDYGALAAAVVAFLPHGSRARSVIRRRSGRAFGTSGGPLTVVFECLDLNLRLGRWTQWFWPSAVYCEKCLTAYPLVDMDYHVMLTQGRGFGVCCSECWEETGLEERLTLTGRRWLRWWGDPAWHEYDLAIRRDWHEELEAKMGGA